MNAGRIVVAAAATLALSTAVVEAQQVQARLERHELSLGESTTLLVVVRGGGTVREPRFDLPPGLEVLGTSQARNFAWTNGRMVSEIVYRYEIAPSAAGHYELGPILVTVGNQTYRSGVLALDATAAPRSVGAGAAGPAALIVEALPANPYVGQQIVLRVRLIQRVAFAEDPQYVPPVTSGFWTDRQSPPESYYADQATQRVLVTETRTRLYPLASGTAIIGEAAAAVVVAGGTDPGDPLAWLGGGAARRQLQVRSQPVRVKVRPLPDGAPRSFTGAVGQFELEWSADRARTARDVPVTLRLDVRGAGNLPLVRAPAFADSDVEVFASTIADSLSEPGTSGSGRKRFQWTVLPRREGAVDISCPTFAWFDPAAHAYRSVQPPALRLAVGPALFAGTGTGVGFPPVFTEHPVSPGARDPAPWAFALSGLVLGVAAALWRVSRRPPADDATRTQQLAWLRGVKAAREAEFWRVADEASAWLESLAIASGVKSVVAVQGTPGISLREQIAVARYGGGRGDVEAVRRRLLDRLARVVPAPHSRAPLALAAVTLAAGAISLGLVFGPHPGDERLVARAASADRLAREGLLDRARAEWLGLWREGGHPPGIAARLSWAHVQSGELGPAALWVLRGGMRGARDPALRWVAERVREGGGMMGATLPRWPVTGLEWSLAALVLGMTAGWVWPRRRLAATCAVLALLAGAADPLQTWVGRRVERAVVLRPVVLQESGIELQPGQVVTIASHRERRLRVKVGRVATGWLPEDVVGIVRP